MVTIVSLNWWISTWRNRWWRICYLLSLSITIRCWFYSKENNLKSFVEIINLLVKSFSKPGSVFLTVLRTYNSSSGDICIPVKTCSNNCFFVLSLTKLYIKKIKKGYGHIQFHQHTCLCATWITWTKLQKINYKFMSKLILFHIPWFNGFRYN